MLRRYNVASRACKLNIYLFVILVEGTPSYFCDQGDLSRLPGNRRGEAPNLTLANTLYALYPGTRLIVMLRNPTDRYDVMLRCFVAAML